MKEILERCRLNEEEMEKFNRLTKDINHKEDHRRAYRTMMNQTRRKLLKFIGEKVRTLDQIIEGFNEEIDQITYHLSMLEQLFYIMNTESGWKATPRGLGFIYNAIMED
jgi:hypothetical protein